jgi:hypothetical protein
VPAKQARRCRQAGAVGDRIGEEKLPTGAANLEPDASQDAAKSVLFV